MPVSHNAQLVLDHFGLEESDLPKLERIVDFDALAKQIRKPTRTAVCNILDDDGKVVISDGKRARVGIEVENAEQIPESMRFMKWF